MKKEKVILAYSGGLDTTAIIPWLKEHFDYDVVCCCIDCGQESELTGLDAVSYTHLDVYRRQLEGRRPSVAAQKTTELNIRLAAGHHPSARNHDVLRGRCV